MADVTHGIDRVQSIRAVRKQHKMTLSQVADQTGISVSFLSDLERGRTAPSLHTLELLATCYDVSLASLLEEETIDTSGKDTLYREIGRRIRAEREALGFCQSDVATYVGLTRTSMVNIESGRQRLPLHALYAIAEAFGVSIGCLLPQNEMEGGMRDDEDGPRR